MALLIKVWGNTYLNPACVGKIEFTQKFNDDGDLRTSTTTVFDLTGQHSLLTATSEVSVDFSNSIPAHIDRDNFQHAQIVQSVLNEKDAERWTQTVYA